MRFVLEPPSGSGLQKRRRAQASPADQKRRHKAPPHIRAMTSQSSDTTQTLNGRT
ncbi:MAG: hypothetical protein K9N47_25195 [Prosthecobacter sp.]|uniref:hypothetical protein n=1 Tax=Prosthecobacter sp. TaxID=1965333 RepID=UPI0026046B8D|nr:hypothetical protein [Prosthecobacter sp.]MCF7789443.1 hypothetical protein [Prosthecobacter sp.]